MTHIVLYSGNSRSDIRAQVAEDAALRTDIDVYGPPGSDLSGHSVKIVEELPKLQRGAVLLNAAEFSNLKAWLDNQNCEIWLEGAGLDPYLSIAERVVMGKRYCLRRWRRTSVGDTCRTCTYALRQEVPIPALPVMQHRRVAMMARLINNECKVAVSIHLHDKDVQGTIITKKEPREAIESACQYITASTNKGLLLPIDLYADIPNEWMSMLHAFDNVYPTNLEDRFYNVFAACEAEEGYNQFSGNRQ